MDAELAEDVPADEGNFSEDFAADIESGWNTENSPQQQSPSNNQQIPPLGNLPPQQQQFNTGNFRGNSRFPNAARGGRGRGGNSNTAWNPHLQAQPTGPSPVGIIPPNLNQPPPKMELWVETKTGDNKSYYYAASSRETTWNRPDGPNIKVMTQAEFEAYSKQQIKPVEHKSELGMAPPNLMDPAQVPNHLQFVPQFNASVPPFAMHPPFNTAPPQWNNWQDPSKVFNDSKVDPKTLAKAQEWTEHRAPDGRMYYYNAGIQQSCWERPQPLKDLDEARMVQARTQVLPPVQPLMMTQGNVTFDSSGNMINNKQRQAELEVEKKRKEDAEKAKAAKPLDKTRPIASTPISGTPWCVVWTGDKRVFFYCPSTRTSVWERPEDLIGRADVDKAVSTIPEQLRSATGNDVVEKVAEQVSVGLDTGKKDNLSEKSMDEGDDTNEEEEIPTKKSKIDESKALIKVPNAPTAAEKKDIIKDGVAEAEIKAAKERQMVPLETRVKQFKDMLKEKEVSAFSTWEKELHKIVFDPRYLLLASKERKQVFEKYVKDRAEDERREKRNKTQKKRDDFKSLMEEANLHSRSSFADFCTSRFSRDDRWKSIEKMRERENLFSDYQDELRRKEKDEKYQKKEQIRKDFFELLRENSEIDRHSHWMDIKKKIEKDCRYSSVGDSVLREDYFYDYIKILKDERKKKKAKKSDKKEKKKKSKDKDRLSKEKNETSAADKNGDNKSKNSSESNTEEKKEGEVEKSSPMEVDDAKSEDGSESEKDEEDGEHSGTDSETDRQRKDRDRQARAEASIKQREQEVKQTLAENLRERDKERQHHKRDEAVRHFIALLADLVRNADLNWKEVKKQLKKDHRWELVETLDREEKEKLFNDHIGQLSKKKRDKFREMLEEITSLELTSSWKDIKRQVRDDPRFLKFGHSDRCEKEFRDYIRDKTNLAKSNFKELLQECKLITHKSFDLYIENRNHLKEIEEILKNDKRYLVLDHMTRERSDMIHFYLEDLKKRGPPAPITASTESSRRK